jgi:predicted hydrocarbon binding protein
MNIKAQGLLNAAKYIEERFGREALADVVRACSPEVRETYASSIAINWHPMEELCEFVDVAEARFGGLRGKLAQDIGAAAARANMKGLLLRIAFYLGKPEYLMKRVAALWRQFNDEGTMELLEMTDAAARVEVRGVPRPNATFCSIVTGWCYETALAFGVSNVSAHHIECRARGGQRCIFEIRALYGKIASSDEPGGSSSAPPRPSSAPPRPSSVPPRK